LDLKDSDMNIKLSTNGLERRMRRFELKQIGLAAQNVAETV
jgi:hypothetical protein